MVQDQWDWSVTIMAITQKHTIDIQPGISAPTVVHCSCGDFDSVISFEVMNGGELFDCSSYLCSVHGVRSDGANWGPFPVTVSGSTVSFPLKPVMTVIAGPCLAEITIGTVGTANFAILVENATFSLGVTYTEDVSVYQNILNYIMGVIPDIQKEAATNINGAIDQMNTKANSLVTAATANMNDVARSTVNQWIFNHISPGVNIVDDSLSIRWAAADSKTVGDRLFAIDSALNKLNAFTSEFSAKRYDYVLDEKLEPILDEIGDPIIANGTDLVLSGPALSGVKDYLFNPETENRWNVWGWSGKTVVIPILYIYGHIPGSKGEGKFKINYRFKDINGQDLVGVGKIGVQGQSSSGLPKKNYSITFADKFLAKNDWLPSKKYTFKSCWNDPTWARNAVSGRLWAQCVASRPNASYEPILDEKKEELLDQNGDPITVPSYPLDVYPNHGTYDGFPIYIIANGKYIGLYTMLIAKDKDMFGIGQYKQYKKTECVVSNEGAGTDSAGGFKRANLVVDAEEDEDVSGKSTAWTYECIPNEKPKPSDYDKGVDDDAYKEDLSKYEADNTKFRASLNTMIQAVVNSTGKDDKNTNYKKVSAQYLDYDSVVDYMIFSSLINAADDVGKNWLLVTYDGIKWFFSAYDLDTTWGNWCPDYNNPNLLWRPDEGSPSLKGWNGYNRAMHMIWTYDPQRLIDRYEYLRSTVFSEENVYREFLSFIRKIPMNAIEADRRLFRTEPNGLDFAQIENWYRLRVKKMDKQIEDLKASIATA